MGAVGPAGQAKSVGKLSPVAFEPNKGGPPAKAKAPQVGAHPVGLVPGCPVVPRGGVRALGQGLCAPTQELEDVPEGAPAPAPALAQLGLAEDKNQVPLPSEQAVDNKKARPVSSRLYCTPSK